MFAKLFAGSGLSLDRLRALLEVGAAGSIVKAAAGDPTRQSQFSRQIKELEDFFETKLVERHGRGIRLTADGRELARISRFFLLGLSQFQRGCHEEDQCFRIGAGATVAEHWLVPVLAEPARAQSGPRVVVEVAADDEIERRLHDLTLDFGLVTARTMSRPLQSREIGVTRLKLWVPKLLCSDARQALQRLKQGRLPMVVARRELPPALAGLLGGWEPALQCSSHLEARSALIRQGVAAILPEFLMPAEARSGFLALRLPVKGAGVRHSLVWNPRLLRLNPHAARQRDWLVESMSTHRP